MNHAVQKKTALNCGDCQNFEFDWHHCRVRCHLVLSYLVGDNRTKVNIHVDEFAYSLLVGDRKRVLNTVMFIYRHDEFWFAIISSVQPPILTISSNLAIVAKLGDPKCL